jgi:hypothetical protein
MPLLQMEFKSEPQLSHRGMREVLTELRTNVDESEVWVAQNTLTLSRELRKLGLLLKIAPSSNGKTADSGSAYRGSNPCGAARPYRLTV